VLAGVARVYAVATGAVVGFLVVVVVVVVVVVGNGELL
jgi:hypothetical protein